MRTPSRSASLLLALALLAIASAAHAVPLAVSLPTVTVTPGATVDVPITTTAPNAFGILSVDYRLSYAANVVQSATPLHDGWIQTLGAPFVTTTSTYVDASAAGFAPTTSTSTLLQTVRIVVSASAPVGTDMPLTLAQMQCNEGSPAVSVTNGLLRVRAGLDAPPFAPGAFALAAAAPDPALSSTRLAFALPRASHVTLAIVGIDGRRVRTLLDGQRPAGPQQAQWDLRDAQGRRVAPGVYLAALEAEGQRAARRLVVVR